MGCAFCRPTSLGRFRSHDVGRAVGTTSRAVGWMTSFSSEQTPVGRMFAPDSPEVL